MLTRKQVLIASLVFIGMIGTASASDYMFRVSCQSHPRFVAHWSTGDFDPGKEYLRFATGLKNPNCSIVDYHEPSDSSLPVERYSDWSAVIQGFPPVGLICGIVGC